MNFVDAKPVAMSSTVNSGVAMDMSPSAGGNRHDRHSSLDSQKCCSTTESALIVFGKHLNHKITGMGWRASFCMLLILLLQIDAQAQKIPVPPQRASIVDLTGSIDSVQKNELHAQIGALGKDADVVIAVLLLPTTGEETIEQYATRVFYKWKLGGAQKDNGMLIVVAVNDRRMRIEVGLGLEGVVPDIVVGRIIDQEMTPHFRDGDYAGGIDAAIIALKTAIQSQSSTHNNEPPVSLAELRSDRQIASLAGPSFWEAFPAIIAVAVVFCGLLAFVVVGIRTSWANSKAEFGVRMMLALGIIGFAIVEHGPGSNWSSWLSTSIGTGAALSLCFFSTSGRSTSARGDSETDAIASSSESSVSSTNGGSSSGGGASGNW